MSPTPEKYLEWLEEGKTFADIRKDLVSFGKTNEEITEWINLIDRLSFRKVVEKERKQSYLWMFVIGLILFFSGLLSMNFAQELWGVSKNKLWGQGLLLAILAAFMTLNGVRYFKSDQNTKR